MNALAILRDAGLTLEVLDGDRLRVTPAALLTPALRAVVAEHKAEILAELAPRPWWSPDALRERNRTRAAALLAELEALPERTAEQETEAAYYRAAWGLQ